MFDFLKKKIKESVNRIQKKLEKEETAQPKQEKPVVAEEPSVGTEEQQNTREETLPQKIANRNEPAAVHIAEPRVEKIVATEERETATEKKPGKKQSSRLLSHRINEGDIEGIYQEIKSDLLENNVALSVLGSIHADLEKNLLGKTVSMLSIKKEVESSIKESISDILIEYPIDAMLDRIKSTKPFVILLIGVNGAGKTTTLAKMSQFFIGKNLKVVASASDTFRAASIEQLQIHMDKLGVDLVKHSYGADPAAVAFDAIKHAGTVGADIVLIDTAGRSDINKNLIEELKKVKKVSKPNLTVFVGDALTGNDVVKQAEIFDREVGIDASVISKADVDKKGGAVLSISYITKKPIMFLGTGQDYPDLVPFNRKRTAEFLLKD